MRNNGKITMYEPDRVFFTADPHFFHNGIIGHCQRPFKDAEEMDEALIRNWNAVVPMNGIVFVLGDMFWKKGSPEQCLNVMKRLNGVKYLVSGNHDLSPKEDYLAMGFRDAWDYLEVAIAKRKVVCFHYPILEWNGFYHGWWHLHGHVHGKGSHFSFRIMDVGVDVHNFMPVPWRHIERELSVGTELDEQAMAERGDIIRHRPYKFTGK